MAQTIVVPLDGSDLGESALPWAALIAKARGDSLTLVRVVPWPDIPAGEFGGYISPHVYDEILEAERDTARTYLDEVKARLEGQGIQATTVVREGLAAEGIHDVADELGAYAVAMASHGRGGMTRLVLGSVAERILQQATIPVLLVRTGARVVAPSLSRLLVPLDGSALAERGLDEARQLSSPGATFVLIRIVEPVYQLIAGDEAVAVVDEEATARGEGEAAEYLARVAGPLRDGGFRAETSVRRGRAATELLSALAESNADVLVMTTHGHTGPVRWLMGSVADEVFRHADRPVFLVSARTLAARAAGPYAVRDLMTRDVTSVQEDETVIAVLRKLLRRRVSGAPVIDAKGELVGVVSEHDLLAWHAHLVDQLSKSELDLDPSEYGRRLETESIAQIVTRPPISIDESADLSAAIRIFLDRRLRRLAVTGNGRLVGIISRADVLKGMAARWEAVSDEEAIAAE